MSQRWGMQAAGSTLVALALTIASLLVVVCRTAPTTPAMAARSDETTRGRPAVSVLATTATAA